MSSHSKLHQKSLFVKDFRNLAELNLQFGEGHNLFIGENGHGKTNCLEAIALACSLKPMQNLASADLIRTGTTHARIMANFAGVAELNVAIDIFAKGKKAKLNDHALKSSSQLAASCPLVSFIPAELNLIAGGQTLRRRALDQAAVSLFAEHALTVRAYEKALLNRNRLLKEGSRDRDMTRAFTEIVIKEGAALMHVRQKTIAVLNDIFNNMLRSILGARHHARLNYCASDHEISDHTEGDLQALLARACEEYSIAEQRRRVTLFGPHLDDVNFLLNGVDAKTHASRGQTRALVFAFKLAQMLAILNIRGFAPIIILDDIVSELDSAIKTNLIDTVATLKTQVFFSTTDLTTFGGTLPIDRVFAVKGGGVGLGDDQF